VVLLISFADNIRPAWKKHMSISKHQLVPNASFY